MDPSGVPGANAWDAYLILNQIKGNGDVDADGHLTYKDAEMIMQANVGNIPPLTASQIAVGNVDPSGVPGANAWDAYIIMCMLTGQIAPEINSTDLFKRDNIEAVDPENSKQEVENNTEVGKEILQRKSIETKNKSQSNEFCGQMAGGKKYQVPQQQK